MLKIINTVLITFTLINVSFADNQQYVAGTSQNNQLQQQSNNNQPVNQQPTNTNGNATPSYQQPYTNPPNPWATSNTPESLNKQQTVYDEQAKQVWLKSCMGAMHNSKLAPYSQEFCDCGWSKISNGSLPENLLISNSPADIQKANKIIQGVWQQCFVTLMANHQIK